MTFNMPPKTWSNPFLYTKQLKEYKDTQRKTRVWAEKAAELGLESGTLLRTYYESVRTKVGKITDTKSGSSTKDLTERDNFIMTNSSFLQTHISRMRGRTAISLKSQLATTIPTRSSSTSVSELANLLTSGVARGRSERKSLGATTKMTPGISSPLSRCSRSSLQKYTGRSPNCCHRSSPLLQLPGGLGWGLWGSRLTHVCSPNFTSPSLVLGLIDESSQLPPPQHYQEQQPQQQPHQQQPQQQPAGSSQGGDGGGSNNPV
ncbi:uncharacterized protein LOC121390155 [Gigantopelta aegis]|uniref:uncharacterized protein LOC121390155 n=1 Tax=Gigantopelta aegis TaxID=1735272 RepID=UPI001B88D642|nr:uncharacterized protein LOC121390155 [Gigantopelta aegis]